MVQEAPNEGQPALRSVPELRTLVAELQTTSGLSTLRNDPRTAPPGPRAGEHPLSRFFRLDTLAPSTDPTRPQEQQSPFERNQLLEMQAGLVKRAQSPAATWDEQMTAAVVQFYPFRERLPQNLPNRNAIETGANMQISRFLTNIYGATEFISTFELYVKYLEDNPAARTRRNAALENQLVQDCRILRALMPYWGRVIQVHFLTLQRNPTPAQQQILNEAREQLQAARKIAVDAGIPLPDDVRQLAPDSLLMTIEPIEKRLREIVFAQDAAIENPRHSPAFIETLLGLAADEGQRKALREALAAIDLTEPQIKQIRARRVHAAYINLLVLHRRDEADAFIKAVASGQIPSTAVYAQFDRHRAISRLILNEHRFGFQTTTAHMFAGTLGISQALRQGNNAQARLKMFPPHETNVVFAEFLQLLAATATDPQMQKGLQEQREKSTKAVRNYTTYMRQEALTLRVSIRTIDGIYIQPVVRDISNAIKTIAEFMEQFGAGTANLAVWGPLIHFHFPSLELVRFQSNDPATRKGLIEQLQKMRNEAEAELKTVQSLSAIMEAAQKQLQALQERQEKYLVIVETMTPADINDHAKVTAAQAAVKEIAAIDQEIGKTIEDTWGRIEGNMQYHAKTAGILAEAQNAMSNGYRYLAYAVLGVLGHIAYNRYMAGRFISVNFLARTGLSLTAGPYYQATELTYRGVNTVRGWFGGGGTPGPNAPPNGPRPPVAFRSAPEAAAGLFYNPAHRPLPAGQGVLLRVKDQLEAIDRADRLTLLKRDTALLLQQEPGVNGRYFVQRVRPDGTLSPNRYYLASLDLIELNEPPQGVQISGEGVVRPASRPALQTAVFYKRLRDIHAIPTGENLPSRFGPSFRALNQLEAEVMNLPPGAGKATLLADIQARRLTFLQQMLGPAFNPNSAISIHTIGANNFRMLERVLGRGNVPAKMGELMAALHELGCLNRENIPKIIQALDAVGIDVTHRGLLLDTAGLGRPSGVPVTPGPAAQGVNTLAGQPAVKQFMSKTNAPASRPPALETGPSPGRRLLSWAGRAAVAGGIGLDAVATVGDVLAQEQRARECRENIRKELDQSLASSFDKVDGGNAYVHRTSGFRLNIGDLDRLFSAGSELVNRVHREAALQGGRFLLALGSVSMHWSTGGLSLIALALTKGIIDDIRNGRRRDALRDFFADTPVSVLALVDARSLTALGYGEIYDGINYTYMSHRAAGEAAQQRVPALDNFVTSFFLREVTALMQEQGIDPRRIADNGNIQDLLWQERAWLRLPQQFRTNYLQGENARTEARCASRSVLLKLMAIALLRKRARLSATTDAAQSQTLRDDIAFLENQYAFDRVSPGGQTGGGVTLGEALAQMTIARSPDQLRLADLGLSLSVFNEREIVQPFPAIDLLAEHAEALLHSLGAVPVITVIENGKRESIELAGEAAPLREGTRALRLVRGQVHVYFAVIGGRLMWSSWGGPGWQPIEAGRYTASLTADKIAANSVADWLSTLTQRLTPRPDPRDTAIILKNRAATEARILSNANRDPQTGIYTLTVGTASAQFTGGQGLWLYRQNAQAEWRRVIDGSLPSNSPDEWLLNRHRLMLAQSEERGDASPFLRDHEALLKRGATLQNTLHGEIAYVFPSGIQLQNIGATWQWRLGYAGAWESAYGRGHFFYDLDVALGYAEQALKTREHQEKTAKDPEARERIVERGKEIIDRAIRLAQGENRVWPMRNELERGPERVGDVDVHYRISIGNADWVMEFGVQNGAWVFRMPEHMQEILRSASPTRLPIDNPDTWRLPCHIEGSGPVAGLNNHLYHALQHLNRGR